LSENWYEYKKNVGTILEEDIFGEKIGSYLFLQWGFINLNSDRIFYIARAK
jgi:hypothetical protein